MTQGNPCHSASCSLNHIGSCPRVSRRVAGQGIALSHYFSKESHLGFLWGCKVMAEVIPCCWTRPEAWDVSQAAKLCWTIPSDLLVISHLSSLYRLLLQYILFMRASKSICRSWVVICGLVQSVNWSVERNWYLNWGASIISHGLNIYFNRWWHEPGKYGGLADPKR